jgi:D-serine deaminase-like pyridoxal phosphate-dependent protein
MRKMEQEMTLYPELDTPALCIDLDKMERNLEEMAAAAKSRGVGLRPHIKSHKMVQIGKRQMALGAVGLTTAKLSEAEVLAAGGLRDLFVCYPIIGDMKVRRLRDLAREANVMTLVESEQGARGLSEAMRGEGRPLDVLIDLDVGFHRVGVDEEGAVVLAGLVTSLPGLRLRGVSTHEGSVYGVTNVAERATLAHEQVGRMVKIAEVLRREGHQIEIVSSGSTPGAKAALEVAGITEMRPGNYVFYDVMQVGFGVTDLEHCAMSVLAQVVSHQTPERAVIDAGAKAFSTDQGAHGKQTAAGHGVVKGRPGITLERLSEEHGWLHLAAGEEVAIGERLEIIPNHACVVTNLFNEVAVVQEGKVVDRWRVAARGCMV